MANDTQRGVEWEGLFNMAKKYGMAYLGSTPFAAVQSATDAFRTRTQVWNELNQDVGSYPFSGTTSNYSSSAKKVGMETVHIGAINNNDDFDVVIRYLERIGHTKILSCPQIAVINNQEAKIHVGEKQAYVTTSTTAGQTTTTVSESVTYVDVGLQLFVTPTINDEGYVTMKIKPEISSVVDQIVSSSNNTIPIIDTVMAETSVMVKDGTTILIGGLNKDEQTRSYKGTPILDKIPLIKYLFSEEVTTKDRVELVILLTPHIITGDELTTGYERDFQHKLDRDFQEYGPVSEGGDLRPENPAPKLYRDYPDLKEEPDDKFAIKPMRNA
jgi:general secretion pathway protein D